MINKILQKLVHLETLIQNKKQELGFNVSDFISDEEIHLDILTYFKLQAYEELYEIKKSEEQAVKDKQRIEQEIKNLKAGINNELGFNLVDNEEFFNTVNNFKGSHGKIIHWTRDTDLSNPLTKLDKEKEQKNNDEIKAIFERIAKRIF